MIFLNDFTSYLIEHSKNDPIPELTSNKEKIAIFVFGVPGSGKSTFINNFIISKLKNYKVFDSDELQKDLVKIGKEIYKKSEEEYNIKVILIKKSIEKINLKYNIPLTLSEKEIKNIIDNNIFVENSSAIMEKLINNFTKYSNADLIYDTTGNDFFRIKKYSQMAKDNGYKILFIKVKINTEQAIHANLRRNRKVQIDYQLKTIEKSDKIEKAYLELNPNAYYIYNRDNKKFTKLK